jgi:hypothetical protein
MNRPKMMQMNAPVDREPIVRVPSIYDQQRARNFLAKQGDTQMRQYLGTLTPAERAKYLRDRQHVLSNDQDEPDAQEAPQQAIRRPFGMQAYSGANPVQQGFINDFGPAAQASSLGGMISDVQDAYQDENDSRVAQLREQRRMDHEIQIEAMRQEALLQRLAMEQKEREKDRILQKQLTSGVTTRQFINGQWVDV